MPNDFLNRRSERIKSKSLLERGAILQGNGDSPLAILAEKPTIVSLFKETGLILFRGFALDRMGLLAVTNGLVHQFMTNPDGAFSRNALNREKTLLSVTAPKQNFPILYHGEAQYGLLPHEIPTILMFYCAKPAGKGGETTICDGVNVAKQLSPQTTKLFTELGLQYSRTMPPDVWQAHFKTTDLNQVLTQIRSYGLDVEVAADTLTIRDKSSAYTETLYHKESAFVNMILSMYYGEKVESQLKDVMKLKGSYRVRLGNGEEIPQSVIDEIIEVTEANEFLIDWEAGDLLLVDNYSYMHGRKGFDGVERDMQFRMATDIYGPTVGAHSRT